MNISASINQASKILPTTWPLKSMIAVNPLWDLHDVPFKDAISYTQKYLPINGCLSTDEYISLFNIGKITKHNLKHSLQQYLSRKLKKEITLDSDQTDVLVEIVLSNQHYQPQDDAHCHNPLPAFEHIKDVLPICSENILNFMMSYFDKNQYPWFKNSSKTPLFEAWKSFAILDNAIGEKLHSLPSDINLALLSMIEKLNVAQSQIVDFFSTILSQLIGWHSYIKWIESRPDNPLIEQKASIAEALLIWCCHIDIELNKRHFINTQSCNPNTNTVIKNKSLFDLFKEKSLEANLSIYLKSILINDLHLIWQVALEKNFQEELISKVLSKPKPNPSSDQKAKAQFIFCIDTRSEGIRRHLEANGHYETFGYAGFFSALFCLEDASKSEFKLQAPALVEPTISLKLNAIKPSFLQKMVFSFNTVIYKLKHNILSPFAFFEVLGYFASIPILAKTFYSNYFEKINFSTPIFDAQKPVTNNYFLENSKIEETANNAYQFLKTIGLVKNMASVIFVCGHQAQTENNPFQASFDCGACGGNSGLINAKITCEILNHPKIRSILHKRGIDFGLDSRFVATCHNTTTDEFIVDKIDIPFIHGWEGISHDVNNALATLKKERAHVLPALSTDDRHINWSELIPEWGLANNAAFIIGPRSYTSKVNLERRVFLHSYDPSLDPDGAILESILTAPVVVAHWINMQYYFSSTDPDVYGSGNKAIHNVVGDCGVIEGNLSDLKIGLPIQSVFFKNKRMHQPLRLLVVIFACSKLVDNILDKNPNIKSLFDNEWASLKVISQDAIHVAS